MKLKAAVAFLFCLLVLVPFVVAAPTYVARNVFLVPAQSGTIILPQSFTCAQNGVTYSPGSYLEGQIYAWYYPLFSSGNGTANLRVSAQNCNFTINSLDISRIALDGDWFNTSYVLNCVIVDNGTAYLDVMGFNYTSMSVYFNGASRQKGMGWNTTDFGVTLQGPATVMVMSSSQSFEPPRNAPADDRPVYIVILAASLVAALAVLGMLKSSKKEWKLLALRLRALLLNGRAITRKRQRNYNRRSEIMEKLTELRLGVVSLYVSFVALIALGQVLVNDGLTLVGLIAFAFAAALTTYYMVETES